MLQRVVSSVSTSVARTTKLGVRALSTTTSTGTGSSTETAPEPFHEVKAFPRPLRTRKYGIDILHDPLWNKSLAFDSAERDRLGLRGLLPPATRTMESQVLRTINHIRKLPDDITKNLYLQELHNRNETLYHRILIEYVSFSFLIRFEEIVSFLTVFLE